MTTISINAETLVNSYVSPMSRELAMNAIEQFGGWEQLQDSYSDICSGGIVRGIDHGVDGWMYTDELVAFFKANKKEILDFAKETAYDLGEGSSFQMMSNFNCFNGDYTEGDIAEGIYDTDSDNHKNIVSGISWFIGEELARSFERMVEDAEQEQD